MVHGDISKTYRLLFYLKILIQTPHLPILLKFIKESIKVGD